MNEIEDDAINPKKLIAELQATFDNDRYPFRYVKFHDDADHDAEMQAWRQEMADSWRLLIEHVMEIWDLAWHHTFDTPSQVREEWLFRRKESPFKKRGVEDCRRVLMDMMPTAPREPEQFLLFTLAVLTQGSTQWPYSECKSEAEMERPE